MSTKLQIRPHHLLCILGFAGKGYSPAFINNYQKLVDLLEINPNTELTLVAHTDTICAPCPHRSGKRCAAEAKVQKFDKRHAEILQLNNRSSLTWHQAKTHLATNMSLERFNQACTGCEWQPLGLCEQALQRLHLVTIEQTWQRLCQSRQYRFEAHYQQGGVSDMLSGEIKIIEQTDTILHVQERGLWQQKKIETSNHYLWQRQQQAIVLSHTRFGKPVRLCQFSVDNHWRDTHICGDDAYHGHLQLENDQLILNWHLTGPNMSGQLRQIYSS